MTEAQVSEAILALASAVSGKDLTSEGDGTKATALTVLSDALGDPETDADTALYDAAQFATRRSTDTEEAAKSVLALSSGGGGAQKYPITVTGDAGAYIFDWQGYPTVQITERAAGEYVVIKANKKLSSDNTGVFGDTVDIVPVSFNYDPDDDKRAYFIMPAGATEIAVS